MRPDFLSVLLTIRICARRANSLATDGTRIKHGLRICFRYLSVFDPCSIRGSILALWLRLRRAGLSVPSVVNLFQTMSWPPHQAANSENLPFSLHSDLCT